MRGLPKRRPKLLQPGMLQPCVKNALKLKAINPEMDVTILFRDMRTYGFNEDYYREASESGCPFHPLDAG
jgi:hypothetical protein